MGVGPLRKHRVDRQRRKELAEQAARDAAAKSKPAEQAPAGTRSEDHRKPAPKK